MLKVKTLLPSLDTLKKLASIAGKRLAFGAGVLLAVIYLTYLGLLLVGGASLPSALSQAAGSTLTYLVRLVQGDLGITEPGSLAFVRVSVAEVLPSLAIRSLGLLGITLLFSVAVGVPLGAVAANRRHTRFSMAAIVLSIIGISMPSFFAALLLQILAIQYTRIFGTALVPVGGFGWDAHLVLPVLVLSARPLAQITRMTYVSMSEILDQDFIRTAHSKGFHSDYVFWIHAFRNAAVPILTTIAVSLRFSLSSLPVVEVYFGLNGLGQTLLQAIFNQDANLTIALFLALGIFFILVNLLLEMSYTWVDPRMRETAATASRQKNESIWRLALGLPREIVRMLFDLPVIQWVRDRLSGQDHSLAPMSRNTREEEGADRLPAGDHSRWRAWRRGILGNSSLLLGGLIVGGLIFLTLYGPHLAPYSPNTTQLIGEVDGHIATPPFPPDEAHPWGTDPLGRDMLSLILAGAQQTLILALSVVIARLLIGVVLGVLAGWFSDSQLDRAILGINQAVAVFPTLLLAALLIFIFGIGNGIPSFVLALSLVGWGEIMQFVRSKVMTIRPKPYIESAVAVGQNTSRLILMHVLPGVAPALISVAALEAGAVLLLLGELGFLGIFIHGGAGTELGLYSQVPEWGALLSGVRTWTRSYPWTGFFPTAAFFLAILGFNFLGEGLRKLVEEVGLVLKNLFNPYTLGFSAILVAGFFWARGNTGELVFYRQQAATFSGQNALQHIQVLADPAMEGRALGTEGMVSAAEYIAGEFQSLGLQRAGEEGTYLQTVSRSYLSLSEPPRLEFAGMPAPDYLQDFAVFPTPAVNVGTAQGPVRFLAFGEGAALDGIDLRGDIILLSSTGDYPRLQGAGCQGVLVIAEDLNLIKRRYTLSSQPGASGCGQGTPALYVSQRLAAQLVGRAGESMRTLEAKVEALGAEEILDIPTRVSAQIEIVGEVRSDIPAYNVIGQLPGTSADLDHKMIIVAAQYDAPPNDLRDPAPGANDNASGVATMLEMIRTIQDSGYQPFKTILFVAYSGEGLPEQAMAPPARSFLESKYGFQEAFDFEAVIHVRGMGVGQENTLGIWSNEQEEVSKLLETAAHLTRMETQRVEGPPSMNVFPPKVDRSDPEIPQVGISRMGWDRTARLDNDNLTFVTAAELQSAGEAVTLGVMILGR